MSHFRSNYYTQVLFLFSLLPFSTWEQLLLLFLRRMLSPLLSPPSHPHIRQVFSLVEQDSDSIRKQLISPINIPILHVWAHVAWQASIQSSHRS